MHLPSFRFSPRHLSGQSAWVRHLPFAYDLVAMLRPQNIVELGTWMGDSFFTFCQAVQEERINTTCYAVDHWKGDAQTGPAGFHVFEMVQQHCMEHYQSFAYLMRSEFAAAALEFGPSTIDLLHIDGFHSYENARQDFLTWFPLVRDGGVVLFHDIKIHSSLDHSNFGVWKLWEELKKQHETREFRNGYGLGVLIKGQLPALAAEWLSPENFTALAPYYETRGAELEKIAAKKTIEIELATLRRQHQVLNDFYVKQSATLAGMKNPSDYEAFLKRIKEVKAQGKRIKVRLSKIVESAEAWQRRSIFKRAFHKWRAPENWRDQDDRPDDQNAK